MMIIETDFGPVMLSEISRKYMAQLHEDWETIYMHGNRRTKLKQRVLQRMAEIERAVHTCARMSYIALGEPLRVF